MKDILLWDQRFPDRHPRRLSVDDALASAMVRSGAAAPVNQADFATLNTGGALDPATPTEIVVEDGFAKRMRRVVVPVSVAAIAVSLGIGAAVGVAVIPAPTPTPTPSPSLSLSSAVTQAEGNSGTTAFVWTLTLNRDGSTASYPYSWAVTGSGANPADAADFGGTFPSGSGTFAPGETSKTITVLVSGDTAVEPNETFTLTVTASGLNTVTTTGTISNDDAAPSFAPFSFAVYDGDSRTANSGGRTVASSSLSMTSGTPSVSTMGFAQAVCGNLWLLDAGHQHGIGGSTTLAMLNRQSTSSIANTGNPAFSTTAVAADANFAAASDGLFSAVASPGKHLFVLCSVNDGTGTSGTYYDTPFVGYQTLRVVAQYLDAALAAGYIVYLADELPRGRIASYMEAKTVSGGTVTATQSGNFVDGESYGAPGVIAQTAAGTIKPLTKVASNPGQDQYTVTSAGVYTFGGTPPTQVWLTYTGANSLTSTPDRLKMFRNWARSSDANFVYNGNDYQIPGAQYNRPNLRVYGSYAALLDTTTGTLELPRPGTSDNLQLHSTQLGAVINAKAIKAKVQADYPSATSLEARPTRNNWYAAKGTGAGTTFSGTLPPSMRIVTPTVVSVNGVDVGTVNTTTGAITGANVVSGSLNFATGAWTITFNAASVMPSNAQLWFEQDLGVTFSNGGTASRNRVMNGMMDMTPDAIGSNITSTTGTSSVTGVSNSQVPYGWSLSSSALNTAIANGTVTFAVGSETATDGYPRFTFTMDGVATVDMAVTLIQSISFASVRFASLGKMVVGYRETFAPGVSGRFYGARGIEAKTSFFTSSINVNSSTGTQAVTALSAAISDSGTGMLMDDTIIAELGGTFDLYRLSPIVNLGEISAGGGTLSSASATIIVHNQPNVPFSTKYGVGQLQVRERT